MAYMVKETVSARISGETYEQLEEYVEEKGLSKSEATDRLLGKALKVESGDVEVIPVSTDGGTQLESRIDSVESSLESHSKTLEKQEKTQMVLNSTLLGSVVWITLQVLYSFPLWFTVTSGVGIILLLAGLLYKVRIQL